MAKQAPVPRTEIEQRVLDGAAKARTAPPIHVSTVLGDGDGRWIGVRFRLDPDGRWSEVSRTDPTGRAWAESWLAEEIHQQQEARRAS